MTAHDHAAFCGAFIVPLPNGDAGSAVLERVCGAVRGELFGGSDRQQLAEHMAHGRWATESDIAALRNIVRPADLAAKVDETATDEPAVLPVAIVELDGCVLDRTPVDFMHSDASSVVGGTSTVAEAGGASSAAGGGLAA